MGQARSPLQNRCRAATEFHVKEYSTYYYYALGTIAFWPFFGCRACRAVAGIALLTTESSPIAAGDLQLHAIRPICLLGAVRYLCRYLSTLVRFVAAPNSGSPKLAGKVPDRPVTGTNCTCLGPDLCYLSRYQQGTYLPTQSEHWAPGRTTHPVTPPDTLPPSATNLQPASTSCAPPTTN